MRGAGNASAVARVARNGREGGGVLMRGRMYDESLRSTVVEVLPRLCQQPRGLPVYVHATRAYFVASIRPYALYCSDGGAVLAAMARLSAYISLHSVTNTHRYTRHNPPARENGEVVRTGRERVGPAVNQVVEMRTRLLGKEASINVRYSKNRLV